MTACKVSVIVPVYNAEATVVACLRSVLEQSYRDIEVLAVDDGSTDDSLQKMQTIAREDDRLRVVAKSNGGVASARNLAIAQAQGEYLQFVDSDDTLPTEAIARLVKAMEQPACDLVVAPYIEVVENHHMRRGFFKEDQVLSQREFLDHLTAYPNSFFYAVLWNKLYRRDIVIRHAILNDGRLPWGEDFAFNTEYYRYIRCAAVISDPVYYYNRNLKGLALSTARDCLRHPIYGMKVKLYLQQCYNQLYHVTGLYNAYRLVLPRYMFRITINR